MNLPGKLGLTATFSKRVLPNNFVNVDIPILKMHLVLDRSSSSVQMVFQIGVIKAFANFTGKHRLSLFNKLRPATL